MDRGRFSLRPGSGNGPDDVDRLLAGARVAEYRHDLQRCISALARLDWINRERSCYGLRCHSGFRSALDHTHSDLLAAHDVDRTLEFSNRHLGRTQYFGSRMIFYPRVQYRCWAPNYKLLR